MRRYFQAADFHARAILNQGQANHSLADAVTIPVSVRGAFHLPPVASLPHGQQRHAVDIANAV